MDLGLRVGRFSGFDTDFARLKGIVCSTIAFPHVTTPSPSSRCTHGQVCAIRSLYVPLTATNLCISKLSGASNKLSGIP